MPMKTNDSLSFTILCCLLPASLALGQAGPGSSGPLIAHEPAAVAIAGQPLEVSSRVSSIGTPIRTVTLNYSISQDISPSSITMERGSMGQFTARIPASQFDGQNSFWYYIEAVDEADEWAETPWHQVQVRSMATPPAAPPEPQPRPAVTQRPTPAPTPPAPAIADRPAPTPVAPEPPPAAAPAPAVVARPPSPSPSPQVAPTPPVAARPTPVDTRQQVARPTPQAQPQPRTQPPPQREPTPPALQEPVARTQPTPAPTRPPVTAARPVEQARPQPSPVPAQREVPALPPEERGGIPTPVIVGGGVILGGGVIAAIASSSGGGSSRNGGEVTTPPPTNGVPAEPTCTPEDLVGSWSGPSPGIAPGFSLASNGSANFVLPFGEGVEPGSWSLNDCTLTLVPAGTNQLYRGSGRVSEDRTRVTINQIEYIKNP